LRASSSDGVTTKVRYSSSVAGTAFTPAAAKKRARTLSSSGKKSFLSGFSAASAEVSKGNNSASTYGTQRKRGSAIPGPMETRFATITPILDWSSTHAS
jgi:hypothetical protein